MEFTKAQADQQLPGLLRRAERLEDVQWPSGSDQVAAVREHALELAAVAKEAAGLPLTELPFWISGLLAQRLSEVMRQFDEYTFALKSGSMPENERQRKLESGAEIFRSPRFVELFRDLFVAFAYLGVRAAKFASAQHRYQTVIENIEGTRRNWDEAARQANERAQIREQEADALIRSLRAAAGESGVARFSDTFNRRAKAHADAATVWCRATIACGLATIALAFLFLIAFPVKGDLSRFENAYVLFARIVVVGFSAAATGWCASMHRVRSHLEEVNRHRATSLNTFRLFVRSAGSSETRDAILRASVKTVFAPGLTGLVSSKDEKANNEIMAVMQSLAKG